jgi:Holliday junction resolvasome RuvABC endonuclease subunit
MLDTSPSDTNRYPLRLSDLIVMNLNPELAPPKVVWAASPELAERDLPNVGLTGDRFHRPMQIVEGPWTAYTGSVLAIDPSGRGKDETGYAVVKMHHGQLYLPDAGGFTGGYDEPTLRSLAEIAKAHKVNAVITEANFGDGMFTRIFQPVLTKVHPCLIEEVKHSIQKEKRIIDTLEPVMCAHRLIIDRKLVEKDYHSVSQYPTKTAHLYRLVHQLTRITRERGSLRQDDRLDAVAIAVAYWVEQMSRDVDLAAEESNQAFLDEEVRRFLEHATGETSEATWIDS